MSALWSNASSRFCSNGSLASSDRRSTKPKPSRGKPDSRNSSFRRWHSRKPAPSLPGKIVSGRCDSRHHAERRAREGNCAPKTNHQPKIKAMSQPNFFRLTVPSLAMASALLLSVGCGRQLAEQGPSPPVVTVAPVERQELIEWDEFTGRTEPVESVEVRPRVSGYIQEVRFQSGQLVRKGDVLFVIDPRWHQAEFDRRQAEFEQARVRLDNARREAERTPQLLANKAISTEESDARQARYQEAKAALLAAQAALDSAKLDLEYTQVHAPIDGRVSRALLTEGNYVSGVAGANTLLTTIVSVDPIYVYADIDENSLLKFNALAQARKLETNGAGRIPVELQLADERDFPHRGFIESFDNHLNPNTGSILLRAVFPNADGRVVPGLFARIRVPLSERHPG